MGIGWNTRATRLAVVGESETDIDACADRLAGRYDVVRLVVDAGVWRFGGRALGLRPATSLARALAILADRDAILPVHAGSQLAALGSLADVVVLTGSPRAQAISDDRELLRLVAAGAGIATTAGVVVDAQTARGLDFLDPVVVRPGVGRTAYAGILARSAAELRAEVDQTVAAYGSALVEEPVLGDRVALAAFGRHDAPTILTPPDTTASAREVAELTRATRRLWSATGCQGAALASYHLTWDGPVLDSLDPAPDLTPTGRLARMAAASGRSYADLVDALVAAAVPGFAAPAAETRASRRAVPAGARRGHLDPPAPTHHPRDMQTVPLRVRPLGDGARNLRGVRR